MSTTSFSPAQAPARERLKADQIRDLQASLIVDHRRRRPLYFDGRFLAARDLVREQQYFLTRQADLGRAGGWGVVEGLFVSRGTTPHSLVLQPGHGVTPAGELVVVSDPFTVDLAEIPEIQRLNAAFGLMEIPHDPPRNRTGLFVLALRPVEFSANPVASYPTTLTGQRTVQDGEIVEGAVATLIPYPDEGPNVSAWARRARLAHEVFVGGSAKGTAAGALPLAIIALNGGTIEWLDVFVVRREVGSLQADVVGLGFAPRGLREAHLLQYEAHLREVLSLRSSLGYAFAATDYFQALPPAGRLPAAAVQPDEFTQRFFPPTVDVDLSIIPEDEIPALVEESLSLPPIDLNRTADELDSTSVVILIPVPRAELRTISTTVSSLTRSLKPAAPGMIARRSPLEHLRGVRLPGNFIPLPDPQQGENAAWTQLLRRGGMLWYVRRKTLAQRADLEGEQKVAQALLPAATAELTRVRRELEKRERDLAAARAELDDRVAEVERRERAAGIAADAKAKTEREAKERADREARERAEREAKDRADREAKERADREAKERSDREAKDRADRETKDRADREAKDRADREAKDRADREAKDRADREAKDRADREAKDRADRDAKDRADREAKERAAREAKERADREAKERADRDAKEQADREAREAREELERERRRKAAEKAGREAEVPFSPRGGGEIRVDAAAEREAKVIADREAKARAEAEAKARADAEAKARADAEAKAAAENQARILREAQEAEIKRVRSDALNERISRKIDPDLGGTTRKGRGGIEP